MKALSLLNLHITNNNTESKYFFIKLIHFYATSSLIEMNVRELSKVLGLTDRVVSAGLKFACEVGYLRQDFLSSGKRGRAKRVYHFEELINAYFDAVEAEDDLGEHLALIEDLLLPDMKDKESNKRRHSLTVSNRLFLAVLLFNADSCGVVRGLGLADLSKLTGMKKDRIHTQIDKLKSEGYIRSHVAGVTGAKILGMQKAVYFLNLRHLSFGEVAHGGITMLYFSSSLTINNEHSEARAIFLKSTLTNLQSSTGFQIRRYTDTVSGVVLCERPLSFVADFFNESGSGRLTDYFQMKLETYASQLLSEKWSLLSPVAEKFKDEQMLSCIKADMLPSKFLNNAAADVFPSEDQKTYLAELVHDTAVGIAQSVKSLIVENIEPDFERMNYLILPVVNKIKNFRLTLTVESFYKDKNVSRDNQLYEIKTTGSGFICEPSSETVMSLENRYKYNLLTRPK